MVFLTKTVPKKAILDLPDGTALTPVSTPDTVMDDGTDASQGISTGVAERHYIMKNNLQRIRQTGLIEGLEFKTGAAFTTNGANIDSIELFIWRRDDTDGFYDFVDSYDFTTEFNALTADSTIYEIDFGSGNGAFAKKDDYFGIRLTMTSGDGSQIIGTKNVGSGTHARFVDGAITTTDIDVDVAWSTTDDMMRIRPLMRTSWGVCVGDSITQGEQAIAKDNGPWENESSVVNSSITYPEKLEQLIGRPIQNSGLSTVSTINYVLTNIDDRVLNLNPKVAFLLIGSNDVAQDTDTDSFESDYKTFLDSLESNGIRPVIMTILPRSDLTDARQANRDTMNTFLRNEAKVRGAMLVDFEGEFGTNRADATKGFNFWNLKSAYDCGDTIHLNETGYAKIADILNDALREQRISSRTIFTKR